MATTLELSRAVNEIVQAVQDTGTEGRSPFFFVVGAGISAPIVPLASVIESDCRKEAEKF